MQNKSITLVTPSRIRASGRAAFLQWITSAMCACALFTLATLTLRAATQNPPNQMAYQGFLTDANGLPLANDAPANFSITFRIFSTSSGGSSLWSEQQTVTVDKGNFSVLLGLGNVVASEPHAELHTVFVGATASDRYIELAPTINNTATVMTPRLHLVSTPFALLAKTAIGLYNNDGSTLVNINAGLITSGTLNDDRLSANIPRKNTVNSYSADNNFIRVGIQGGLWVSDIHQSENQTINGGYINGKGTVPVGTITAYYGDLAALPAYWRQCDGGTYFGRATPNLRGRYIVGAGAGGSSGAVSWGFGTVTGSEYVWLQPAHLPPHSHHYRDRHFAEVNGAMRHNEYSGYHYGGSDEGADNDNTHFAYSDQNTSGGNGLNGAGFSIIPPSYALYYIMRVQ